MQNSLPLGKTKHSSSKPRIPRVAKRYPNVTPEEWRWIVSPFCPSKCIQVLLIWKAGPEKSKRTELHHLRYYQSDKLSWTIEICGSCHWYIDPKKRKALAKKTGRYIPVPYGEFYLNKKQRKEKEEQDKRDWYKKYCLNLSGGFVPYQKLIPTQELYDKVVEAIKKDKNDSKKEKTASKKDTMSNVARRYC